MENLETVIWESGLQTNGVESGLSSPSTYSTQLSKAPLLLMVIIMLLINLHIWRTHLGFLGAPAIKGNHQVMLGPDVAYKANSMLKYVHTKKE